MADTVRVEYLYPPGMLDGDWDGHSGNRRVKVLLSGTSDGTGETSVKKVDLSDLKTQSGKVPARTVVEKIKYQVLGMTVKLEWDRAPAAEIITLNASSTIDSGEFCLDMVDPGGDDRTGDILLTSTNYTNGDTYNIVLELLLKD